MPHAATHQDERRHDESHLLDLTQPFFVHEEFGSVFGHYPVTGHK